MRKLEHIKTRIRKLRAQGNTFSEISKTIKVHIPKSTYSNWCANIKLPAWYKKKVEILNKRSLLKAQRISRISRRVKREQFLKNLRDKNRSIPKKLSDPLILKMLLAVLYLGEGTKWKSHRGLTLGNSDPNIIKLYIRLLKLCFGIKKENLKCRISYRADQNIYELEKYWARITGISKNNFYKTKPDPRTIGKPTKNKKYKGVCVVSCAGTEKQLELEFIPELILAGL